MRQATVSTEGESCSEGSHTVVGEPEAHVSEEHPPILPHIGNRDKSLSRLGTREKTIICEASLDYLSGILRLDVDGTNCDLADFDIDVQSKSARSCMGRPVRFGQTLQLYF